MIFVQPCGEFRHVAWNQYALPSRHRSILVLRADTRLDGALRLASSALIEFPRQGVAGAHAGGFPCLVRGALRPGLAHGHRCAAGHARRAGRMHGGRRADSADAYGHKLILRDRCSAACILHDAV